MFDTINVLSLETCLFVHLEVLNMAPGSSCYGAWILVLWHMTAAGAGLE